ncbi:MAG: formimidoylglutamase [Aliidiomarina sp.]|uniref:formimidoylglutamase n=1 Tax=Aliidiomarina sp. TaxID=1872439 RepID=UPI0025C5A1B3|nr:formimidoylglutamase [Aliidiomarina sp.]MCH8500691.1 formimidoylglutamase [Aliidiomarina sp.]
MRHLNQHWQPLEVANFLQKRRGETRIGETIRVLSSLAESELLEIQQAYAETESAVRPIAILGVPESIGPRANLGRGGAELGWQAFLQQFLNLQDSGRLPLEHLFLAGSVACSDLQMRSESLDPQQSEDLQHLRDLCAELDSRVASAVTTLIAAGFEVILIGGGHNNALPLLQSLAATQEEAVAAVNLDPHSDFRPLEGRHSGNGFSYAHEQGVLAHYHVVGLHEAKNSKTTLDQLQQAGFNYIRAQQVQQLSMRKVMPSVVRDVVEWGIPFGIELDVDVIMQAPASALNFTGIGFDDACTFVRELAALPQVRYLHLAEAAPSCHPAGLEAGTRATGQILSELVLTYLLSRNPQ